MLKRVVHIVTGVFKTVKNWFVFWICFGGPQ